MWKRFLCQVLRRGNHAYKLRMEHNAMFLECSHCGRRSEGWNWSPGYAQRGLAPLRLQLDELAPTNHVVRPSDAFNAEAWDAPSGSAKQLRLVLADESPWQRPSASPIYLSAPRVST
jgi:hypothetical protein